MNKLTMILTLAVILAAFLLAGCTPEAPDPVEYTYVQPTGDAVFSEYVAVGNSLTAGFMDAGLVVNGQINSYPQLIANQIGIPQAAFVQPIVSFPGIGSTELADPAYAAGVLHWNGAGISVVDSTLAADVQTTLLPALLNPTPYQNMAVPGATLTDFTDAIGSATSQSGYNPFFDFILRNPDFGNNTNMQTQAAALGPSLITLWLGSNDVLGAATGGQPNDGVLYPGEPVNMTPPPLFAVKYAAALDGMITKVQERTKHTPLVFVANVPSITSAAYFMPTALFRIVAGLPDSDTLPDAFMMTEADAIYVRFPALGYLAAHAGDADHGLPLPADYTLSPAEVDLVENTVDAFNVAIADAADARSNVFLIDTHALLASLDPMTAAAHFVTLYGSGMFASVAEAAAVTIFSLDGIHPNNHGYGLVANEFISAINDATGADIAPVNLSSLVWDPTYGQTIRKSGSALLDPEAAAAIDAVFR